MQEVCSGELLDILQWRWRVGRGAAVTILPADATPSSVRSAEDTFSPFLATSSARRMSAGVTMHRSMSCLEQTHRGADEASAFEGQVDLQITLAFPAPAIETGARYPLHRAGRVGLGHPQPVPAPYSRDLRDTVRCCGMEGKKRWLLASGFWLLTSGFGFWALRTDKPATQPPPLLLPPPLSPSPPPRSPPAPPAELLHVWGPA